MGRVAYKALCLDAVDARRAVQFWAPTLGLRAERRGTLYRLVDEVAEHTVWINPVPEAKTVKQRVHLDVNVAAVSELTDRGAQVLDDTQHWTMLADPEGAELCAFVRPATELTTYRFYELVVDSRDPPAIARWWATQFGAERHDAFEQGFCWLEKVPGLAVPMVFAGVPEPKTVKNRIHWDVWGHTPSLIESGARLLRARDADLNWDVLADPEGNEFCVFAAEE